MTTYEEELFEIYDDEEALFTEDERIAYKDSTHDIVSKVGYLIGVPKYRFEDGRYRLKLDLYETLDKNKTARIVRNLCIVRASIERNFGRINDMMRKEFKSIFNMPDLVPQDALNQLEFDGVASGACSRR